MSLLALAFLTVATPGPPATAAAPPGALPWRTISHGESGEVRYALPRVSGRDYPPAAKNAGIEGTSLIGLEVNPGGQIIRCQTVASAGLALLDEQACAIYRQRARFQFRGITTNLHFRAPVVWKLDGEEPKPPKRR